MKHIGSGKWDLINSDAMLYEIHKIQDIEKVKKVLLFVSKASMLS